MPDTITVPALGKVPKKGAAIAVVVTGGLALVVWYRHRASAAAANAGAATAAAPDTSAASTGYGAGYSSDPYPPDGTSGDPTDPDSTDPSTGQTYGDEQAGYGSAADYGAAGSPLYSGGDTYPATTTSFTTNAQWAQYAEQYLVSEEGLDANSVGNALGKYITGQPVTAAQQTLIEQAIAFGGYPPVNGGSGYPPSIDLAAGSTGQVKVPAVTGLTVTAAQAKLTTAGLSYNPDTAKDKPGYDRKVTAQNPKAGTSAAKGTHIGLTWHYVKS